MCTSSPPPAPDYAAAARAQGTANIEAARIQGQLNNPNIYSPYGTQTVSWPEAPPMQQPQYDQRAYDAAQAAYQPTIRLSKAMSRPNPEAPPRLEDYAIPTRSDATYGGWPAGREPLTVRTPYEGAQEPIGRDEFIAAGVPVSQRGGGMQPTIVQTLTPNAQAALDAQQRAQRGLGELASLGVTRASDIIGERFDPNLTGLQGALPSMAPPSAPPAPGQYGLATAGPSAELYGLAGPGPSGDAFGAATGDVPVPTLQASLGPYDPAGSNISGPSLQTQIGSFGTSQGGVTAPDLATSIDTSGIAQMPVNAGMTGQQAIMSRLGPQLQRREAALLQRLANQGLVSGGEAYGNAMLDESQRQNDLLSQAALYGIGLDTAANQQGFGQAQAQGAFGNQAQLAAFNADLANQQAANQAIDLNFMRSLQGGQFGNQAQLAAFGADVTSQELANRAAAQNFGQDLTAGQFGNQAQLAQFGAGVQGAGLYNMALGQNFAQSQAAQAARNQSIQQNFMRGQAANAAQAAAIGQNFGQGMASTSAQNAARAQLFNQQLQGAQFGNLAQQQSLAQQLMLRSQPLKEIAALMSGSQIQTPQFPGYQGVSNIGAAPIYQASRDRGDYGLDAYQAQVANKNAMMSGLFDLGVAGIGMAFPPAGLVAGGLGTANLPTYI